jgi:hypothetical protein
MSKSSTLRRYSGSIGSWRIPVQKLNCENKRVPGEESPFHALWPERQNSRSADAQMHPLCYRPNPGGPPAPGPPAVITACVTPVPESNISKELLSAQGADEELDSVN